MDNIKPQHPEAVFRALQWYGEGVDLSDALHVALSAPASEFLSLDKPLQKNGAVKWDMPTPLIVAPPLRPATKALAIARIAAGHVLRRRRRC